MRAVVLPVLCVVTGACTSPFTFDTQAAHAACDRIATCDEDALEAVFGDLDGCVDAWEGPMSCFEEHCSDFTVDEAVACLADLREADCDEGIDPTKACGDVWSDCSELELGACLLTELAGGD